MYCLKEYLNGEHTFTHIENSNYTDTNYKLMNIIDMYLMNMIYNDKIVTVCKDMFSIEDDSKIIEFKIEKMESIEI